MSEHHTPQRSLETNKTIEKQFQQYNGVHSSHSSRSSSPSMRLGHVPSSQLPPTRPIPQSQLPPSRSPITAITQQVSGLNVNSNTLNATSKFSTSTPTLQKLPGFVPSGAPSPVTTAYATPTSNLNQRVMNPISGSGAFLNQQQSLIVNSSNQPNLITSSSQQNSQANSTFSKQPTPTSNLATINGQNIQQSPKSSNQFNHTGYSNVLPTRGSLGNLTQPQLFKDSNIGPMTATQLQNLPKSTSNIASFPQPVPSTTAPQSVSEIKALPNTGFVPISAPNLNYNQQNSSSSHPTSTAAFLTSQGLVNNSNVQEARPLLANTNYRPNLAAGPLQNPNYNHANLQQGANVAPPMPNNQNRQATQNRNNTNNYYAPQSTQNQRPPAPNYNSFNTNLTTGTLQSYQIQQPPASQANVFNGPPTSLPPSQNRTNLHSNRYPSTSAASIPEPNKYPQAPQTNTYVPQPQLQQNIPYSQQNSYQSQTPVQQNVYNQHQKGVAQLGYNKMWGTDNFDLLQTTNILPVRKEDPPKVNLGQELLDQANCHPDIFRCTMTKIPENNTLLQKSRLPLGVLIHPFKDLSHLPVIQCNVIVRCRACRTYINPFVFFVDSKRWKCNLCYRVNELPEEFQYDPVTKTYGDPSRRPEIKSSTLEYIAPAEYMLRPPQPAVYLFLLDVSRLAVESGYLSIMTTILLEEIENLPGDARTQIGFITYDSALHFYSMTEGATQPHEMTVLDIDDVFLPTPENLLVNLKDKMELIKDLLLQLPNRYINTYDNNSALGAAVQVAFKMMGATGGRVTVFQASLPNVGPGALTAREDPSQRSQVEVAHLNPSNDFYKRLALECSSQQIAVDLFVVNSQYVDIATISGISRFSGGCIHHFPLLKPGNNLMNDSFSKCFRRYLTRKIGFEAVMRVRCTRGLAVHTFHGNFFVRSTDLLSLPNINPDAGFGMQVSIEESLSDVQSVCFQAALLYTSSKGERRIRVHTMCLPVVSTLHDIIHSADQECIVGVLSKMAVDRSMQSGLSDAREAFMNVAIDILSSYKLSLNLGSPQSGLLAAKCIGLLPLYISALLKHLAFRVGGSTRLDDRVMAMIDMKSKPLYLLLQQVYPDLYPVHDLESQEVILNAEEEQIPIPPRLQLTARCLESKGAFLMDAGDQMIILVCPSVSLAFLNEALGVADYNAIPDNMFDIPVLENARNRQLLAFVNYLNEEKPYPATLQVLRDNSAQRMIFFQRLIEDRMENALSYHEFLQHLKTQVK